MVLINRSITSKFRAVNGYFIHVYDTPGSTNIQIAEGGNVEVLVVAGGGSGGNASSAFGPGGGGGGGEVAYVSSVAINTGNMSFTVGEGGSNANGGNSTFGSIETNGGGMGGTGGLPGSTGGSSGGAGRNALTTGASVKLYAGGFGNAGGIGITGSSSGAGGGGAFLPGGNANGSAGGTGGQGYVTSSFSLSGDLYGSGGGGGARGGGDNNGGNGGGNSGKGGGAETSNIAAMNGGNGVNGYGGGGGGAGIGGNTINAFGIPGMGGCGCVIIKYAAPPLFTLQSSGEVKLSQLRSVYSISTTASGAISLSRLYGWTGVPSEGAITGPVSISNFYGKTSSTAFMPFNETGLTATYDPFVTMPGGTATTHTLLSVYNYQISGLAGWSAVRYRSNGTQVQVQNYGNLRTSSTASPRIAPILRFLAGTGRTVFLFINLSLFCNSRYASTNNNMSLRILITVNGSSTLLYETPGTVTTATTFRFNITPYIANATSFSVNFHFNLYNSGTTALDNNRLEVNRIWMNVM